MVRSLRVEYENAWYHVMNRGLERRNIFLNNNHKKVFLDLLSEVSQRYKVDIHCYCLMSNHYHLLLNTKLANLNQVMKHLNGVYTLRFNRDVRRDGPLFRGRYKSIIVDKENYLLNVSRYIHKNPSSAKIDDDKKYIWSSYRYYCNSSKARPKWLETSEILGYFNGNNDKYAEFVEKGTDKETNKFYSSKNIKSIFGNKSFIREVSNKLSKDFLTKGISNKKQMISVQYPSFEDLLLYLTERYGVDSKLMVKNESRNRVFERSLLIYLLMLNPRYNISQKGSFIGISGDAVTKSYKRFTKKLNFEEKLKEEVDLVVKDIYKVSSVET